MPMIKVSRYNLLLTFQLITLLFSAKIFADDNDLPRNEPPNKSKTPYVLPFSELSSRSCLDHYSHTRDDDAIFPSLWISKDVISELKKSKNLPKNLGDLFFEVLKKSESTKKFASKSGESGIKVLSVGPLSKNYKYELKLLGSGVGAYRLLGRDAVFFYTNKNGERTAVRIIEFIKLERTHH